MFFKNIKNDYKAVFDGPTGRRVLRHLMKVGFVSVPLESGDDHENAVRSGKQHLVLSILQNVHSDTVTLVDELLEEGYEDERPTKDETVSTR